MDKTGVIYILTNPSFPEYVKIGYADDIDKRLQQLNRSECIPFAFRVYATYEVNSRLSDLKIHSIIDKLNPNLRSIENFNGKQRVREFYAMSPEDAYSILEAIAEIHGCADKLKRIDMDEAQKQAEETAQEIDAEHKERQSPFRFSMCNIQPGEEIEYCKVLQPIGSVFEHSNQQKRFFTKEKFDEKFQKRIDYFSKVAMSFFANHGYDTEGFTINPYMVVNKVFSSYYKHVQFPIVTFDELKREIQL